MPAQIVRNIAPFINDEFSITSHWWYERIDPITGEVKIHRGLDIATTGSKPVYSMLNGYIHSKGTNSSAGNWVVICDDNSTSPYYGYATLYMHLALPVAMDIGTRVRVGEYIANEGSTGHSTGIHLHLEMQDISRFNWRWHSSYTKSDYLDPTEFMGIDNIDYTHWIYDGIPHYRNSKEKFPWVLFARKLRNKHNLKS